MEPLEGGALGDNGGAVPADVGAVPVPVLSTLAGAVRVVRMLVLVRRALIERIEVSTRKRMNPDRNISMFQTMSGTKCLKDSQI